MRVFQRLCVYCGSSNDVAERYFEAAREVGAALGRRGIDVVYGGGNVGLMGVLADASLAAGAKVYGVIPDKLMDLELGHRGVTELYVVDSMHARKTKMADLSDGFIALPGGWGTLEEIFEVTTWTQLGYHDKPVGILNAHGYYDHLVAFLDHAKREQFIRSRYANLIQVAHDIEALIDLMQRCELPTLAREAFAKSEL